MEIDAAEVKSTATEVVLPWLKVYWSSSL